MKRLLSIFPQKHKLIYGIIITIFVSSVMVVFSYLLKELIDVAIEGRHEQFFILMGSIIALGIFSLLMVYARTLILGRYTEKGMAKLRHLYSEKVLGMSFDALKPHHSGDLLSRGTNDMNRVRQFTFMTLPQLIGIPLTAILAIIVLFILSWQLILITIGMVPILIIGSTLLAKPIGPASKKVQTTLGKINMKVTDFIRGVEVAKAYTLEEPLLEKHHGFVDESIVHGKKLAKRRAFLESFSMGFAIIPFAVTFVLGGYFVIEGNMTVGSLLAFINLLNFITFPMGQFAVLIGDTKRDMASAQRIFEIIDSEKERTDGEKHEFILSDDVIAFNDVSFGYKDGNAQVLNHISLKVKRGESIAFVGPSGGGKSTLMKLLMGYFDDYEGDIMMGGHELKTWHLPTLRDALAYVSQQTFLFPESIEENIGHGKLGADKETIVQAAKKANAHEFILQTKDQYDTSLGELGNTLSGGQKQRLSIARAIIKDAPVLLLDEATSALDTESEAIIQAALHEIMKEKTSIVVAHRLSTIKDVDKIVVIDQGSIAESGSHDELLAKQGVYARLYERQTQLKGSESHEEA